MTDADTQQELTPKTYRQTIGLFATGVSVLSVTTPGGEVVSMTANAITSVSLDPLLLLVCVGKNARIAPYMAEAKPFSLSFLTETQENLSNYFAGIWPEDKHPPEYSFQPWWGALPRLSDCLGAVACTIQAVVGGGDHWIVIGRVAHLYRPDNPGAPLVFYNGLYRTLDRQEELK